MDGRSDIEANESVGRSSANYRAGIEMIVKLVV